MTGPARAPAALAGLAGLAAFGLVLALWGAPKPRPVTGLRLSAVAYSDLPDWAGDDHEAALATFSRACTRLLALAPDAAVGGAAVYGAARDWQPVCAAAREISPDRSRSFFETAFRPFAVSDGVAADGLFTGYYESDVRGSAVQGGPYQTPIYARPDDLIDVDLGDFAPDLKGRRTAGRIEGNRLKPFPDRQAITGGALRARARVLYWLDSPIDAFFLEIQGSGRVTLPDGDVRRVTFAGQNGHAYTALGQVMIRQGLMRRDEVSMASLRRWLEDHPDRRDELLSANRSYVFFRDSPVRAADLGPPGADGQSLTAGRSLAVDRSFHALGVPFYLTAIDAAGLDPPLHRLMIAQDTGGAIRGVVRGDVFWGFGPAAEARAGRMKDRGQFYVLLPNDLARRIAAP